jgi:long-chain acyl-CoA synthetase
MTECAPLISFAPPCEFKSGSCGKYLPGLMEAKINSKDPQNIAGEIMVYGENVMMGYYKNEEATKAVLDDDGWLHTGDMGVMDPDGTIYIKGRCKTMILTGTGQNIYPEEIEDKLNNLPMVLESLIVERKGVLTALVVPDYDTAAKENVNKEELHKMMEDNLKTLNAMVASYERVARIEIHEREFEKTPKRSIKRFLYQDK